MDPMTLGRGALRVGCIRQRAMAYGAAGSIIDRWIAARPGGGRWRDPAL